MTMNRPTRKPRVLPLRYLAPGEVNVAKQVVDAFRGSKRLTRRPRNPDKAAWLREQGVDPDQALPG